MAALAALEDVELVMSWSWRSTITKGTLRIMQG